MTEEKYYESQNFENLKYREETFRKYRFVDCSFTNCTFEECVLVQSSFSGCTFCKCTITSLRASDHSQIQNVEFTDCNLIGVHWDELLPAGKFAEPIKKLQTCRLKYNTFAEMDMRKFDFSGQDIMDSMFAKCRLMECNFKGCNLERTEFFQCNIQKADFRQASGYQVDVLTNKMSGARFSFPEVMSLLSGLHISID
ncbi:pentapeptide repeat-containing protein [Diplocloster agilis]|uniref:pentapeptide repeat-containing protein n=1 Tax=Diplocloster agilis TaxID=2850323 RepID=UPI000822289F|nr:pentapeptide repeat-containing protein [Suonthocola fibrivorans]MCU6734589.1 pentapeptide repeat-containing protein [Suonthocola fibrivorans]SCJ45357.1 Uncharacterized protein conserved in bacteria [uncultured Clostridium sp.]